MFNWLRAMFASESNLDVSRIYYSEALERNASEIVQLLGSIPVMHLHSIWHVYFLDIHAFLASQFEEGTSLMEPDMSLLFSIGTLPEGLRDYSESVASFFLQSWCVR